jgi:rhodanese-related sulfurtransferase
MNLRLNKKNLLQIVIILLAGMLLGLGRNYFSQAPLPLFKGFENPIAAEKQVQFGEVDADFVGQLGSDPGTVLLDARLPELFERGHIPGAVSLPLARFDESLAARLGQLRSARLLVVYCSGRQCGDSHQLALKLRAKGFSDLLLYRGGIEDWLEKGNALDE